MITKFKEFEAKLYNLAKISAKEPIFKETPFDDEPLIVNINLPKFNKIIKIDWNNTEKHNIKNKIKNRSQILNISEFNEIFENVIKELFYDKFNEIQENIDSYDLYLTETNLHILIVIKYEQLFKDKSNLFVLTILPNQPKQIDKIIKFEY